MLLSLFAERFLARGSGALVGVSSVAGDRGRGSNYFYGAAKAGFTAFLSGLRNRLAASGIRVVTVKPGFVRTQMTADMKLPPLLTGEPAEVAAPSSRQPKKAVADVVYVRPIWRVVMTGDHPHPRAAVQAPEALATVGHIAQCLPHCSILCRSAATISAQ
jgi:NAD(P)-dependent dehydrogenase (short-subunit alcohol dehydrogenase family)